MTLNDLECPIHLKVRFTDGMLDVRTLWLSDSTICTGIARGSGGGVGWRAYPPLHPCGPLTRCFSAVAELLVSSNGEKWLKSVYIYGSYRENKTGAPLFWTTR